MTYSDVRRDPCRCVTYLIHTCDMNYSHAQAIRLMVITAALYAVLRNAVTAWWILARSVMTATKTLAMAARHAQSMCAETD